METLRWELPACRVRGGARERVSHPEEAGAGSISQSGSFLCSSVGGGGTQTSQGQMDHVGREVEECGFVWISEKPRELRCMGGG
jgi:hypothetical protein